MWGLAPVISVLWRLKQEAQELKVSLGYIAVLVSKKKKIILSQTW